MNYLNPQNTIQTQQSGRKEKKEHCLNKSSKRTEKKQKEERDEENSPKSKTKEKTKKKNRRQPTRTHFD